MRDVILGCGATKILTNAFVSSVVGSVGSHRRGGDDVDQRRARESGKTSALSRSASGERARDSTARLVCDRYVGLDDVGGQFGDRAVLVERM